MNSSPTASKAKEDIDVTVVTITKGDFQGLVSTIASVKSQVGGLSVQHVIVDADASREVKELVGNYVREAKSALTCAVREVDLIAESDNGRYDGMNKGLRMARGKIIWLMHSGDTFAGTDIAQSVVDLAKLEYFDWGYGFARLVDSTGQCVGIFGYAPFSLRRFSLGGKALPHQSCFFSSSFVTRVGEYDTDHGLAADQLYLLRCATLSPPILLPIITTNFDTSGVGTKRTPYQHFSDMARARKIAGQTIHNNRVVDFAVTWLLIAIASIKDQFAVWVR